MNRPGSILGQELGWHGDRRVLDNTRRTGQRIGALSAHGIVKRLVNINTGIDNRYVIKFIKFKQQQVMFKEQPKLKMFRQEVAIGQLPGIEGVGPKIHAWRLRPDGGEYIMDNVEMGDPGAQTFTYYQIRRKYPGTFNNSIKMALKNFHEITGGQHGDLHGENILFVKHDKSFTIQIIDYGSWKSDSNTSETLENSKNIVPIYRLANGRLFRKNQNMITELLKSRANPLKSK